MGVSSQCHVPAASPPGESPGTHCIECWGGVQDQFGCMGRRENVLSSLGSEAGTVQPVAESAVPTMLSCHPDIDQRSILTWILRIFLRECVD